MRKLIRLNLSATSSNTHVEKIVIDIQTLRIALMIFKGKKIILNEHIEKKLGKPELEES